MIATTEHAPLAEDIHQLELELAFILRVVDEAIGALDASDPVRADLQEIRIAAGRAAARVQVFETHARVAR